MPLFFLTEGLNIFATSLEQAGFANLFGDPVYRYDCDKVYNVYKKAYGRGVGKLSFSQTPRININTNDIGGGKVSGRLEKKRFVRI